MHLKYMHLGEIIYFVIYFEVIYFVIKSINNKIISNTAAPKTVKILPLGAFTPSPSHSKCASTTLVNKISFLNCYFIIIMFVLCIYKYMACTFKKLFLVFLIMNKV